MSIDRMAQIIKIRRNLLRPLTPAQTERLVNKLLPIIAPIDYRIAFLPMHDLIPEESPAKWN